MKQLALPLAIVALVFPVSVMADDTGYYSYDQIAKKGDLGTTAIGDSPSINETGSVAFIAKFADGEGIFVGGGGKPLTNINPAMSHSADRTFGRFASQNKDCQVLTIDRSTTGGTLQFRLRTWKSSPIDTFEILASAGMRVAPINDRFDSILGSATLNDRGDVAFPALDGTKIEFRFHPAGNDKNKDTLLSTLSTPQSLRPSFSQDGRVALRAGDATSGPIVVFNGATGSSEFVAPGFTSRGGAPGISADGRIVVFAAERGNGPGIFASIDLGGPARSIVRVAGENSGATPTAELGRDQPYAPDGTPKGNRLFFNAFDMDSRVAVIRTKTGPITAGDGFLVCFVGTPNLASAAAPELGVRFSSAQGIWSIRVEVDSPIVAGSGLVVSPGIAIPVCQVGDVIAGIPVQSIRIHEPLAPSGRDRSGASRTSLRGDHFVAFHAGSTGGDRILRANHYDLPVAELRSVMTNLSVADATLYIDGLNRAMTETGIVNKKRKAALLAQIAAESTELKRWEELFTLAANFQLPGVSRPPHTATSKEDYFNYWYHDRVGNGSVASGDGFSYRGAGPMQLTGRSNFARFGTAMGFDLIGHPELVSDKTNHPEIGLRVAAWFCGLNGINPVADSVDPSSDTSITDTNKRITQTVNGGLNGVGSRLAFYKKGLILLSD